jgi:serine/threonine protein kinase/Tol biopolymer transport system component
MSSSPDRAGWARVDALLDAALDRPPERRRDWLAEACHGDEALLARVLALLAHAEAEDEDLVPSGGLRGPVWEEVARELGPEEGGEEEIAPGRRLGPYEVRGVLGVGGMGRVLRAHDPGLDREVAIKALTGELSADADRLRRFEREARVLAALNHPNIGGIYGLHVFDGKPYLVLELVEGADLDERLAHGPLPVDEAVGIARQVAEALEEAHAKGIVHRDLKPANVKVGRSGRVKVLDFGLARRVPRKEAEAAAADSLTREGTILGTVPYMSPEQARGEEVDGRTDVWALGCLLYEMLAGRRAFGGPTVSDLLASVLRDEADFTALPPETPPGLRRLLRRCLRKDPRRRIQHVGDVRVELEELPDGEEAPLGAAAAPVPRRRRAALLPWAVAGLAVLSAIGVFLVRLPAAKAPPTAARQVLLDLPEGVSLASGDYASPVALSPDGRTVVLLAGDEDGGRLYRRSLERLEWAVVPGTDGAWQPFFSSDGKEVGFFADRKLKRVALDGAAPVTVTDVGRNPRGAAWLPDGTIVFGPSQTAGLVRVSAYGGRPSPLTELDAARNERSHRWPQVLPDGRSVLFTVDYEDSTFDDADLAVVSLETGERRPVLRGGAHGRYVASGHILYARGGRLYAVPFDASRLKVTGAPVLAVDGVAYDLRNGGTKVTVAENDTVAYVPGPPGSLERRLVWVDGTGERRPLTAEPRPFLDPRLSPDSRRVAVRIGDLTESNVWTLDVASGTLAQVTFGLSAARPTWTRDGRRLTVGVFDEGGWRIVSVGADGQGAALTLVESPHRLYPGEWSPNDRVLVYQERTPEGWDIRTLDTDAEGRPAGEPRPAVATPANETNPALSPDGRFLAFESDAPDGLVNVYIQPFDRAGAKVQASSGGGRWPHWGAPGELFYWSSFTRQMIRVPYQVREGRLVLAAEERLWTVAGQPVDVPVSEYLGFGYDFDARSRRFLMMESTAMAVRPAAPRVVLAFDWVGQLARPTGGR